MTLVVAIDHKRRRCREDYLAVKVRAKRSRKRAERRVHVSLAHPGGDIIFLSVAHLR